jgi:hypothetical protein
MYTTNMNNYSNTIQLQRAISFVKTNGTECNTNPIYQILEYLSCNEDYSFRTNEQFKEHLNIDLCDPRNANLLATLGNNPIIKVIPKSNDHDLKMKRCNKLGIECVADLHTLFKFKLPLELYKTDCGLTRLAVSEKEIMGAFPNVEMEVDQMTTNGDISCVCTVQKNGYTQDTRIFFPGVSGVNSSLFIRNMWHKVKLPCNDTIKKTLLQNRIRTHDYYNNKKTINKLKNTNPKKARKSKRIQTF